MLRIALLVFQIGLLVTFDASTPAHAQASRTWVSGVGDDMAAICSRTAPCKTFAAAISVTATNGEINCIDPGGYGSVTITKSITIDCTGTIGSIISSGVNSITINLNTNPDPLRTVVLRGLSLNGTSNGTQSGLKGVSILSAGVVVLEDMVIMNHAQQGVSDTRTGPGELYIKNSVIRSNAGVGILAAATGGTTNVSLEHVHSIHNLYGLATGAGNNVKIVRSVFSGNSGAGVEGDPGSQIGIDNTTANFNGIGLQNLGSMWVSNTDVAFNTTAVSGSPISFGNNRLFANTSPGSSLVTGAASTDHGQQ